MKLAYAPRASAILYQVLASQPRRPLLLPANICPIVPLTFLKAGTAFRFVDISPITLHMDLDQAQDLLKTGDYGGVLYAHSYGETSTPSGFFAGVKALNPTLLIVDDRCLCPPDALAQEESQVDVTLYSSGYAKIVDLGYGGYAFLADSLPYAPHSLPYAPQALAALEESYPEENASLTLSPNPATQTLRIGGFPHPSGTLNIFRFDGKKVWSQTLHLANPFIDIGSLPSGLYFVRLNGYSGKFIKQ